MSRIPARVVELRKGKFSAFRNLRLHFIYLTPCQCICITTFLKHITMSAHLTILCCILLSCYQTGTTRNIKDPALLYRSWIHSQEEDDNPAACKVYRAATYHFPPARGRDGFEIKKGGTFVSHPIAAADGNMAIQEKWRLAKNVLTITGKTTTRRFRIVYLSTKKLFLKPI